MCANLKWNFIYIYIYIYILYITVKGPKSRMSQRIFSRECDCKDCQQDYNGPYRTPSSVTDGPIRCDDGYFGRLRKASIKHLTTGPLKSLKQTLADGSECMCEHWLCGCSLTWEQVCVIRVGLEWADCPLMVTRALNGMEKEDWIWRFVPGAAAGVCRCVCVCVCGTDVVRTPPHLYGNHTMALQCPLLVESDEAAHTIILSAFRTHLKQIKNDSINSACIQQGIFTQKR